MEKCPACHGSGTVVETGTDGLQVPSPCPVCTGYGLLKDGTRITISGHDHNTVKDVLTSVLEKGSRSRKYALLTAAGAIGVAAVGALANISQVLTYLGL